MAWITDGELLADLGDDAPLSAEARAILIDAAQAQVEAYAPALPAGTLIPARYKLALLAQIRELARSRARDGDVLGYGDGYAVRVKPLDTTVKALLRPPTGTPVIA